MTFETNKLSQVNLGGSKFQDKDPELFTTILFSVNPETNPIRERFIDVSVTREQAIHLANRLNQLLNETE